MGDREGDRPGRADQVGQPERLEERHGDVAAPRGRRTVQRIGPLLHLVTHPVLLEHAGDHRQAVGQSLPPVAPGVGEVECQAEVVAIAVVVPHAGITRHPELPQRTVPTQTDDVAGRRLRCPLVCRAAHVFPTGLILLVAGLGLGVHLVEDAAALEGGQFLAVLGQRQRPLANGQVQVQRRDPEGLVPQQLLDRDREPPAALVPLHRQATGILLEDAVVAEPSGRVGVAELEQIDPDGVEPLDLRLRGRPLGIAEHDHGVRVEGPIARRLEAVGGEDFKLLAGEPQVPPGRRCRARPVEKLTLSCACLAFSPPALAAGPWPCAGGEARATARTRHVAIGR